jgi:superfamily II DNA or RNA helicase
MDLRPYQKEAVDSVLAKWVDGEFDRLLGVAPTASGKTIKFAHVAKARVGSGPVLILAHRDELLDQAIAKIHAAVGLRAAKEKADERASPNDNLVVASVQTLSREGRLKRFPPNHFSTAIVDEAHHTPSDSYLRVLERFDQAKVLGVTATPDRGDKQSLNNYYQELAFEILLTDLIRAGWLCPVTIKTVPLQIDISQVRMRGGDYSEEELAAALEPMLQELARAICDHAQDRKTLIFLPLVRTSYQFAEILRSRDMQAEAICGESPDRKEILTRFSTGNTRILCNAMLLTEGYDEPSIDCVICLRPTRVRSLYAQMIGRGTRICEGKENLLVLDFLWLSREHDLVRPAVLIAADEREAAEIEAQLSKGNGDLLVALDAAKAERERVLARRLAEQAREHQHSQEIDLLELSVCFKAPAIVDYVPTFGWEHKAPTPRQIEILTRNHVDLSLIRNRGHASVTLDALFKFKRSEPATERQKWFCHHHGHSNPWNLTKREAGRWIEQRKAQLSGAYLC